MQPNQKIGVGIVLLNCDKGSRNYGRILVVVLTDQEAINKGYGKDKFVFPGGFTEGQPPLIAALREAVEEGSNYATLNDILPSGQTILQNFQQHVKALQVDSWHTKAGATNFTVYAVLQKNDVFSGPRSIAIQHIRGKPHETERRIWMSINEISNSPSSFHHGNSIKLQIGKLRQLAVKHGLNLA